MARSARNNQFVEEMQLLCHGGVLEDLHASCKPRGSDCGERDAGDARLWGSLMHGRYSKALASSHVNLVSSPHPTKSKIFSTGQDRVERFAVRHNMTHRKV